MSFTVVDAAAVRAGRGPHPAASPFDKRISEHLGVVAFEVYQVELPPGGLTEQHTHVEAGSWWTGNAPRLLPGSSSPSTSERRGMSKLAPGGLTLIAICAAP